MAGDFVVKQAHQLIPHKQREQTLQSTLGALLLGHRDNRIGHQSVYGVVFGIETANGV